jgi:hypothetical protein
MFFAIPSYGFVTGALNRSTQTSTEARQLPRETWFVALAMENTQEFPGTPRWRDG